MMKSVCGCLAICALAVLVFMLSVGFKLLKKHEVWIRPDITGQVVLIGEEQNGLAGIKVVTNQDDVAPLETITDEQGRFRFEAITGMERILPLHDPCHDTYLSCEPSGYKKVTVNVGICNGDVYGDSAPRRFVRIKLASVAAPDQSVADVERLWPSDD